MYRLNTYPLIHINLLHALLSAFALTPLMERFEAEHGTLTTGAMFFGRELDIHEALCCCDVLLISKQRCQRYRLPHTS